jgi:hypothetical protein
MDHEEGEYETSSIPPSKEGVTGGWIKLQEEELHI